MSKWIKNSLSEKGGKAFYNERMAQPKCAQCKYYFVTWNPKTPYGCRQYGIQSKEQPSQIVKAAGMGDCQGFSAKTAKENPKASLDLNRKDLW